MPRRLRSHRMKPIAISTDMLSVLSMVVVGMEILQLLVETIVMT